MAIPLTEAAARGWQPTAGHTLDSRRDALERAIAADGRSSLPPWDDRLR